MNIPHKVQDLCQALLRGLNDALGEKLFGVYLYGALAFPEGGATGDVDFHVILKETLNSREKMELKDLHATIARNTKGERKMRTNTDLAEMGLWNLFLHFVGLGVIR